MLHDGPSHDVNKFLLQTFLALNKSCVYFVIGVQFTLVPNHSEWFCISVTYMLFALLEMEVILRCSTT